MNVNIPKLKVNMVNHIYSDWTSCVCTYTMFQDIDILIFIRVCPDHDII